VDRRRFVATMSGAAVASPSIAAVTAGPARLKSTADQPPRKVIVGTAMRNFWVTYPGLEQRLSELAQMVDRMVEQSQKKYSRGLDLAVLPETVVTGDPNMRSSCPYPSRASGGAVLACAMTYEGAVQDVFARKAREHGCYIVVPMHLLENQAKKLCSNVSVVIDRKGETMGIYRKVHVAASGNTGLLEGGTTPGKQVPVFDCDFGRLGVQICFDIQFDYGWWELARKGAELVAWPTQSPQTARPAFRAMQHRYYIVSSTWRHNASVFGPLGRITAQIMRPEQVLAHEVDLSYAVIPWGPNLANGMGLKKKYGDKVGYTYYEEEDCGIFWSNDRQTTIAQMARSLDLKEAEEELQYVRNLYHKSGVPGY
jgi:predicted amidohydrolase